MLLLLFLDEYLNFFIWFQVGAKARNKSFARDGFWRELFGS